MTVNAPHSSSYQAILVTIILAGAAIVSSWLLAGHNWLGQSGQEERQIDINTRRLDRVEAQLRESVTVTEYQQLIDRIMRLETMTMEPCGKKGK